MVSAGRAGAPVSPRWSAAKQLAVRVGRVSKLSEEEGSVQVSFSMDAAAVPTLIPPPPTRPLDVTVEGEQQEQQQEKQEQHAE